MWGRGNKQSCLTFESSTCNKSFWRRKTPQHVWCEFQIAKHVVLFDFFLIRCKDDYILDVKVLGVTEEFNYENYHGRIFLNVSIILPIWAKLLWINGIA